MCTGTLLLVLGKCHSSNDRVAATCHVTRAGRQSPSNGKSWGTPGSTVRGTSPLDDKPKMDVKS